MKNIKELRDELIKSFDALSEGKLKTKEAKEITNMAGKIIMSAKTQLDYNKSLNRQSYIEFLEVEEIKPNKK
jgi:hypothetical protein